MAKERFNGKDPISSKEIAHLFTSRAAKKAFKSLVALKPDGWNVYGGSSDYLSISLGVIVLEVENSKRPLGPVPETLCHSGEHGTKRSTGFDLAVCSEWRKILKEAKKPNVIIVTDYEKANFKAYVYDEKNKRLKPAPEKTLEKLSCKFPGPGYVQPGYIGLSGYVPRTGYGT